MTSIQTAREVPTSSIENRFHTLDVSIISASHCVHDTYQAFLAPLLPVLIPKLSINLAQAGLLSIFLQFPSIIQPFLGYISDRVNLRYAVILAPAITATAMSLLGVAPGYAVVALLLVIAGLSSAALHSIGPVLVGRYSGSKLGMGMSFWMVGGEMGRTLGPIAVVTALSALSLPNLAWIMAGGWAVSLALYMRIRSVPMQIQPTLKGEVPWWVIVRRMAPVMVPMMFIQAARSFTVGGFSTYLPTYLTREGSNLWLAGISLSVMQIAGVAGAMLGGSLSDRLGRRLMLAVTFITTTLMIFSFLMGGWMLMPALVGIGLANLSIPPVQMAVVQENFPENRALANGIFMFFNFVLQSLATLLVGLIADRTNLYFAYQVCAYAMLAGLPFILLLPKKKIHLGVPFNE